MSMFGRKPGDRPPEAPEEALKSQDGPAPFKPVGAVPTFDPSAALAFTPTPAPSLPSSAVLPSAVLPASVLPASVPLPSGTASDLAPPLKPFSKRGTPMATRPTSPPLKQPDVPRRVLDLPGQGARRGDLVVPESKRLTVGREIRLSGEISACDYLIVEGRVQANLNNADTLEVAEGGEFKGSVQIAEAIISGRFEGEMIATRRVVLNSTGEIIGTVRTAALVVEEGGRLRGNVSPLDAPPETV